MVKVRFELDAGDWHGHGSETLWASIVAAEWRCFRIINSPFFTRGISYMDTVAATPENHMTFKFDHVERRGGHSTYMILHALEEKRISTYWNLLERIGCSYESMQLELSIGKQVLLSVDIPPASDLDEACEIMERGQSDGVWMFQEGYKSGARLTGSD
jgi:hypothetical protein